MIAAFSGWLKANMNDYVMIGEDWHHETQKRHPPTR